MNREYHKYLQPFWVEQEKKIEEYFSQQGTFENYDRCDQIKLGMLVTGGMPATFQVQGFHYINYEKRTGKKIKDMKSIIEVGGGYGIMCRLIKTLNDCPYTIIDIPIISKLQQYILRNDKNISFVTLEDVVNGVSIANQDMFISLYALSETSGEMIKWVLDNCLFFAKNILMCFQQVDDKSFIFSQYRESFKKYGDIQIMDPETFYLIR